MVKNKPYMVSASQYTFYIVINEKSFGKIIRRHSLETKYCKELKVQAKREDKSR